MVLVKGLNIGTKSVRFNKKGPFWDKKESETFETKHYDYYVWPNPEPYSILLFVAKVRNY